MSEIVKKIDMASSRQPVPIVISRARANNPLELAGSFPAAPQKTVMRRRDNA